MLTRASTAIGARDSPHAGMAHPSGSSQSGYRAQDALPVDVFCEGVVIRNNDVVAGHIQTLSLHPRESPVDGSHDSKAEVRLACTRERLTHTLAGGATSAPSGAEL